MYFIHYCGFKWICVWRLQFIHSTINGHLNCFLFPLRTLLPWTFFVIFFPVHMCKSFSNMRVYISSALLDNTDFVVIFILISALTSSICHLIVLHSDNFYCQKKKSLSVWEVWLLLWSYCNFKFTFLWLLMRLHIFHVYLLFRVLLWCACFCPLPVFLLDCFSLLLCRILYNIWIVILCQLCILQI